MHMALNTDEWLKLHTSYCNRMCSWITVKTCESNSQSSEFGSGDKRCTGCNGLDDQAEPLEVVLTRSLQLALEEVLVTDITSGQSTGPGDAGEGLDDLGFSSPGDEVDFCEVALGLFPGMQEIIEEDDLERQFLVNSRMDEAAGCSRANRRIVESSRKKYAVFMGRCPRCKGYIVNSIERHDDDVYRCFTCGWRTSPEYAWNRANQASLR